jgi:hypothetical protein
LRFSVNGGHFHYFNHSSQSCLHCLPQALETVEL